MSDELMSFYLMLPDGRVVMPANLIVREKGGRPEIVAFRYTDEFLADKDRFALDPVCLPLQKVATNIECSGWSTLGLIEDHLPDQWGCQVLAKQALVQQRLKLNTSSVIDMIKMMGRSRIGALMLVSQAERLNSPIFDNGADIDVLARVEMLAERIDAGEDLDDLDFEMFSLAYLASPGTGVGGARPKALIYDDEGGRYLAKFNRKGTKDAYNNAKVELACLNMARDAGISAGRGKIKSGVNGRDVLLLERFDVTPCGGRRHLITLRSLLRTPVINGGNQTHGERGGVFRYDDIHTVLTRYSQHIANDSQQLLLRMIFNRAINNLDDHDRNFSMVHDEYGWHLSPAYDMVPTLERGGYPNASFGYSSGLPAKDDLLQAGRVFGLTKPEVARCVEAVNAVVSQWMTYAQEVGVDEDEANLIQGYFPAP